MLTRTVSHGGTLRRSRRTCSSRTTATPFTASLLPFSFRSLAFGFAHVTPLLFPSSTARSRMAQMRFSREIPSASAVMYDRSLGLSLITRRITSTISRSAGATWPPCNVYGKSAWPSGRL